MVPDSAAPNININIYIHFLSVPLNFIQNDYAKAGAGYVKGVEIFKNVSHLINFSSANCLSTFVHKFSQFQGLRFCAQTSAVCTVQSKKIYLLDTVLLVCL